MSLEKKYNLGVSPATIRNEMVALTRSGYLKQPHTSAGRIPTPVAMKFYINQLMDEKQMSVAEEVRAKEDVWDSRKDADDLMESAVQALSQKTQSLSVAAMDDGSTWVYGHSKVFGCPELSEAHVCASIFSILEQEKTMADLFFSRLTGASPIEVLFGSELGWDYFDPVGIVASRFRVGNREGAIGVVGSFGLNYPSVIPAVRYFGNLISQLTEE